MADSFSTNLLVRLPATGAYNNTWGATLNSDALQNLDTGIAGSTLFNIGAATSFSVPALVPGTVSQSRAFVWNFTGTNSAPCTVTIPSSIPSKVLVAINNTSQTLILTYSGSTNTVTVNPGEFRAVYLDGTNVWAVTAASNNAAELGGTPAANWVRQSRTAAEIAADTVVSNSITVPTAWPWYTVTDQPTITLAFLNGNAQSGNSQQVTLAGNRTIAAPAFPVDGAQIDFLVIQDSTGGRTLTWNSVFVFENGLTPVLATAPGASDLFNMKYNQGLGVWLVNQVPNLSSGVGTVVPLTISQNTYDFNLLQQIGNPGTAVNITIKVAQGVVITSSDASIPAMDLSGLPSGSTVNLINLGYIQGRGGDGGDGGIAIGGVSFGWVGLPRNGSNGGLAIKGPGSGCTLNISNGNGNIWGGGGGGGGGGVGKNPAAETVVSGAPGGGGAGGGRGGKNFAFGTFNNQASGSNGGNGTVGPSGALGAAGTAGIIGSTNAGVAGGGGTWGTAGTAGTAATGTSPFAPGTGGAAGAAVALNGGTGNFTSGGTSPNVQGAITP